MAWVHSGAPRVRLVNSGSHGFISAGLYRCGRVHSGSRMFTSARLYVVGFIAVPIGRARCRRFFRVRVSSLLRPDGSFDFASVQSGANICCRVHLSSREFTRGRLGVVWFIRVCVGSLRHT